MYEHPIKRAGLTMNRILFSSTRMVRVAFPEAKATRFNLSFKLKAYENGKTTSTLGKSTQVVAGRLAVPNLPFFRMM